MEDKRFLLAILLSGAILFGFQMLTPRHTSPQQVAQLATTTRATPAADTPRPVIDPSFPGNHPQAGPVPADTPRLRIDGARVRGSLDLRGAKFDDLLMRDYHETANPKSPDWPLLIPRRDAQPTWAQLGWSADDAGIKLPDNDTVWTSGGGALATDHPVSLTWDNGAGLQFRIGIALDKNYMFEITQSVHNTGTVPVTLHSWARVRRDYTPVTAGTYILHEGPIGVVDGRLQELTYAKTKSGGVAHDGVAYDGTDHGGWAGITDKYMLTAIVPDQHSPVTVKYRHFLQDGSDHYQVDIAGDAGLVAAPGGDATATTRLFAGAKEVHLLDRYEHELGIPSFDKAVDFGWFYFLTKPIFYALDWLNGRLGNFGLAILVFTVFVKLLFFPLANKSYRSMNRMKQLGPKMTALRERLKDDPAKMQQEMLGLYKTEGVNPASGCLPMIVQIPVFFALYKVIYVTIEMWHAPFYGWIHDLSVPDPTNVFTLFGLVDWDPTRISPLLHLGIWPLIMGCTMFLQQMLNPPPPDPTQAKLLRFMPVIFTFMLGRFPAGLVIYWSWNNTLTILQQAAIQRTARPRVVSGGRGVR